MNIPKLQEGISTAVRSRVFPGGTLVLGDSKQILMSKGFGRLDYEPSSPVPNPDTTLYDLASLTKPLVTAALTCIMVSKKILDLDSSLSQYFPDTNGKSIGRLKIRQLLDHTSGLPSWRPFFRRLILNGLPVPSAESRKALLEMVLSEPLENEPGEKYVYSDLDFIILGRLLEVLEGSPLDVLAQKHLFKPLDIDGAMFFNLLKQSRPQAQGRDVAPTEKCSWRNRVLRGEVHDENAWAAGGVEGHAGLFGTAMSVLRLSRIWLEGLEDKGLLSACSKKFVQTPSGKLLGWDRPSEQDSRAGSIPGTQSAFGHLGFTGTSVWISRETKMIAVLLTNRVHPDRKDRGMAKARIEIHNALWKAGSSMTRGESA
ncbi:MAG: serine hydrolase [Deltaproteobacteria bacterium]|nr:serine hydrolase [Deltaproteobacteria bacterium]